MGAASMDMDMDMDMDMEDMEDMEDMDMDHTILWDIKQWNTFNY